jgi:hypothetical protein
MVLFIIYYSLFVIHYSLFIIHYSLFIIHYSLFIIHYSLFIIHYYILSSLLFINTRCPRKHGASSTRVVNSAVFYPSLSMPALSDAKYIYIK